MKKTNLFLALTALFSLVAFSPAAHAATAPDLGDLNIGDEGDYSTLAGLSFGTIPSNSKITFTYSFSPSIPTSGAIVSGGSYSSIVGSQRLSYISSSTGSNTLVTSQASFPFFPISTTSVDPEDMPVFAEADLATATASVTNLAAGAAGFTTFFVGWIKGLSINSVHYAVSAVPLPAALPLFGMGLVGLAALRRRKVA